MIKKRVLIDKEIEPKVKLDLRNASINSIMKYSMATIDTTEAADNKVKSSASKCLREIIIGKDDTENKQRISNWYLRYNNNIATIHSQKMKAKLCTIFTDGKHLYRLHI